MLAGSLLHSVKTRYPLSSKKWKVNILLLENRHYAEKRISLLTFRKNSFTINKTITQRGGKINIYLLFDNCHFN